MKTSRAYLLVIAAAVTGAVLFGYSSGQEHKTVFGPTTVAVCDIVHVFNNYDRAKDLTAKLNVDKQKVQAEGEQRTKAIEAIQLELDALNPTSDQYTQRLNEAQRLTIEGKVWLEFQQAMVMKDHHRLTKEMYDQIIEMISQVARQQGIQIVLYHMREELPSKNTPELVQQIERRKVLYADDSVNLTETVLARLNEAYRTR